MRRGRIFIYLALIVIIMVVAVALFLMRRTPSKPSGGTSGQESTPQVRLIEIITAGQNISPGVQITDDMLGTMRIPENMVVVGEITNRADAIDRYSKYQIDQGVPIIKSMLSEKPGNVNLSGSSWSAFIPIGQTAVAVPISRLSSAAYGIRDGDYVDIIVTMLVVDIDATSQTVLPNVLASLEMTENGILKISQGNVIQGHFEVDDVSKMLLYVQPSETQRPRMVTQMILQNIPVLHVGNFPLPGETGTGPLFTNSASAAPTATPAAGQPPVTITKPDIITLMVPPQDAVTLTYLMYSGVQITMTLRNPNDKDPAEPPEATTLEYLLTQYNIPIPAKLPYSVEPRVNNLTSPRMTGDATATPRP